VAGAASLARRSGSPAASKARAALPRPRPAPGVATVVRAACRTAPGLTRLSPAGALAQALDSCRPAVALCPCGAYTAARWRRPRGLCLACPWRSQPPVRL